MKRIVALAALCAASSALADEGMWTFNNFPVQKVKEKYGFAPSKQWLEHVQQASARLAGGCSASFVSDSGLVMTNHHCARGCIDQLSTRSKDLIKSGFYARAQQDERQCPAVEVNRLVGITDATDRMRKATEGLDGAKFEAAEKAEKAKLEKDCTEGDAFRCDLVRLYQGGLYHLYKYQRFQDVRLVFAPEHQIAFFGGDPDNFEFPRYVLDVTFFRVYQDGKPAKVEHFFKWSDKGAQKGELSFVSGNPGKTSRLDTIAKLEYARDYALPERLFMLSEMRGLLHQFQERGKEQTRISNNLLFSVENALKALKGRRLALVDQGFFNQLRAQEKVLRDKVNADPKLRQQYGQAWGQVEKAVSQLREVRVRLGILERGGTGSSLFSIARTLHRAAAELPKPNAERLPEFADAKQRFLKLNLFSPAPIYKELETALLTFYLTKLREQLGPDDPVVKSVLGRQSAEQVATKAIQGSRLFNPKVRQQLWDGGQKAVSASKDPMLALVAKLDAASREVRKRYEEQIESVLMKNEALIARARFDIYGTGAYPDATFSPRLSYGTVEGYVEDGEKVEPLTYIAGTFERATGQPPFDLPPSWLKSKDKLNGKVPMNFVSSNDIIGGNSGSPVVSKEGEIIGLIFDGNVHSLGGEYGFDPSVNRAISVHSEAITESLKSVYNAQRLLKELRPAESSAGPTTGGR